MCSCVCRSIANPMNKYIDKQFHWEDIHTGRIDNKFIINFFFKYILL